jgi:pimeloyl-ACP methyl ester carboxylesterase
MVKPQKVAAIGVAGGLAGLAAAKFQLWRWSRNPNPLAGEPLGFPLGLASTVRTDDGAELAIRRAGTGLPVVVVHGLTGNRDDWGPVARRLLNDGFEVVAVELRGHGDSTPGADGYGAKRLAADLAQVLSALDLRDVVLVGHSMGAMAAMTMTLEHPVVTSERVRKLAIVASAATLQEPQIRAGIRLLSIEAFDRFAVFDERLRLGTGFVAFGRHPNLDLIDHLIESTARCPHEVRREATNAVLDYSIVPDLHRVEVDTLVVGGTSDWITPLRFSEQIAAGIPSARLQLINGGGHMIMFESADRVAFLLAEFARKAIRPRSAHSPLNR